MQTESPSDGRAGQSIPVVDVAALRRSIDPAADATERKAVVRELGRTLEDVGFVYLSGHGIAPALVEDLRQTADRFHALSDDTKLKLRINDFHRGYIPYRSSIIETSTVAAVSKPNLSTSLMVMHEMAEDDPAVLRGDALQGPNQWPEEVPELRDVAIRYMSEMGALARDLAVALAEALGLFPSWFLPHFDRPTTFLRLLNYPQQEPDTGASGDAAIGSAPHTDYGFITLLAQDDTGGLEVRAKDGTWIAAPPISDTFVMNVGDILQRWSNGRFASTPHRVINRSARRRTSQPFFFDPSMNSVIECPASLLAPGEAPRFPPVCWGDYLMERLNRNYNYRKSAA